MIARRFFFALLLAASSGYAQPIQPRGSLVTPPTLAAQLGQTLAGGYVRVPPTIQRPKIPALLDQGRTPRCGGYGSANYERLAPRRNMLAAADADKIYIGARNRDAKSRGDDTAGVYPGNLIAELYQQGYILERWPKTLWSEAQIREAVLTKGPVMVAMPLFEGMWSKVGPDGLARATGEYVGDHWSVITWYDEKTDCFEWANSYGPKWGKGGLAYIPRADFKKCVRFGLNGIATTKPKKTK